MRKELVDGAFSAGTHVKMFLFARGARGRNCASTLGSILFWNDVLCLSAKNNVSNDFQQRQQGAPAVPALPSVRVARCRADGRSGVVDGKAVPYSPRPGLCRGCQNTPNAAFGAPLFTACSARLELVCCGAQDALYNAIRKYQTVLGVPAFGSGAFYQTFLGGGLAWRSYYGGFFWNADGTAIPGNPS